MCSFAVSFVCGMWDCSLILIGILFPLSFYHSFYLRNQFSKSAVKGDQVTREIESSYKVDAFKKELEKMKKSHEITNWKHKDEEVTAFMRSIADDYGLIHKYYPETVCDGAHSLSPSLCVCSDLNPFQCH